MPCVVGHRAIRGLYGLEALIRWLLYHRVYSGVGSSEQRRLDLNYSGSSMEPSRNPIDPKIDHQAKKTAKIVDC